MKGFSITHIAWGATGLLIGAFLVWLIIKPATRSMAEWSLLADQSPELPALYSENEIPEYPFILMSITNGATQLRLTTAGNSEIIEEDRLLNMLTKYAEHYPEGPIVVVPSPDLSFGTVSDFIREIDATGMTTVWIPETIWGVTPSSPKLQ